MDQPERAKTTHLWVEEPNGHLTRLDTDVQESVLVSLSTFVVEQAQNVELFELNMRNHVLSDIRGDMVVYVEDLKVRLVHLQKLLDRFVD
jgi:hypothetical protein